MALIQITEPGVAIDPHQRKRGAGVDLGTTHSLIAVVRGGSPVTLPDASDRHLLPSVVRYESEGITVVKVSPFIETEAESSYSQPKFINAVIIVDIVNGKKVSIQI